MSLIKINYTPVIYKKNNKNTIFVLVSRYEKE